MNDFGSFITFLRTDNLEKTTQFYTSIMNCPLIIDQGLCRIFQITENSFIGFCSHFLEEKQDAVCLTFVCDTKEEVDNWYKKLKKEGVKVKDSPKNNLKFNIYNFFAEDPNGITLEIQVFLHPFP